MNLSLYHLPGCPYCVRVRHAADHLGLKLRLIDISRDPEARKTLKAARGRTTVPVLRIEARGRAELMGESEDIVDFLAAMAKVRGSAA